MTRAFRDILHGVYASVGSDERWHELLHECTRYVGADAYCVGVDLLSLAGPSVRLLPPAVAHLWTDDHIARYRENPWLRASYSGPLGTVFDSTEIAPITAFRKSDFFNELLRTADWSHTLAGPLFIDADGWGTFAFNRHVRTFRYGEKNVHRLKMLLPHLSAALKLHVRLDRLASERNKAREALSRVLASQAHLETIANSLGGSSRRALEAALAPFGAPASHRQRSRGHPLGTRYGLTPSELKLARLLAQGYSLKESADLQGVSINTVRSHLAHLFSKTETKRQSQLVRLILSFDQGG